MADLTNNGICSKCGQCCSNFIPLTKPEVKHLRELVKGPVEVQIKTIEDGRVMMLCPFLIVNHVSSITKCSIYDDRPSICKFFDCSKPDKKFTKRQSLDYEVVDLMKDIIEYDYQKDNGMTYAQAMSIHLSKCAEDEKEGRVCEKN